MYYISYDTNTVCVDCAAKERSQETAVTLFGLIFGMYFANVVNSSRTSIWISFILLSFVHMYANFKVSHTINLEYVSCIVYSMHIHIYRLFMVFVFLPSIVYVL
jgi:hypothetical protein